jgi:hypothetical protein
MLAGIARIIILHQTRGCEHRRTVDGASARARAAGARGARCIRAGAELVGGRRRRHIVAHPGISSLAMTEGCQVGLSPVVAASSPRSRAKSWRRSSRGQRAILAPPSSSSTSASTHSPSWLWRTVNSFAPFTWMSHSDTAASPFGLDAPHYEAAAIPTHRSSLRAPGGGNGRASRRLSSRRLPNDLRSSMARAQILRPGQSRCVVRA